MFPVYAGVILTVQKWMRIGSSVPRVCGGDPTSFYVVKPGDSVFPVYAGVILECLRITLDSISVPRVCGGDPQSKSPTGRCESCSPCMRG